jgi:hypothetical protein
LVIRVSTGATSLNGIRDIFEREVRAVTADQRIVTGLSDAPAASGRDAASKVPCDRALYWSAAALAAQAPVGIARHLRPIAAGSGPCRISGRDRSRSRGV